MRLKSLPLVSILFFSSFSPLLAQDGNEPPRELTERGEENLVAFTRLLGIVRAISG
jgi:hypothetical protein